MRLSTIALFVAVSTTINPTEAFITTSIQSTKTTLHHRPIATSLSATTENEEARALLEKVAQIRAELATLEGKSLSTVEAEAQQKKDDDERRRKESLIASSSKTKTETPNYGRGNNRRPSLPEDNDTQIKQAAGAVERAFAAGLVRQTIRLALVPEGDQMYDMQEWPGGAQQMSREAGIPLTQALLKELRIEPPPPSPATTTTKNDDDGSDATTIPAPPPTPRGPHHPPTIKTQDIWDFDGSALVTAESSRSGPAGDVQALVLANTDIKYTRDIRTIDDAMGASRLFVLINPFWRDIDSWGVNLLSPRAKSLAREVIFENGDGRGRYEETYCFHRFSVRGEICAALKVYPHDWQLFAYLEDGYTGWETPIWLGESEEEPGNKEFVALLNEREEFKLSKNMRMMRRR